MTTQEIKKLVLQDLLVAAPTSCSGCDCGSVGLLLPKGTVSLDCVISTFRGGVYDAKRIAEMKECGMFDESKLGSEANKPYYVYLTKKIIELLQRAWEEQLVVDETGRLVLLEAVSKEMRKELE
jgi:hypothetical protein